MTNAEIVPLATSTESAAKVSFADALTKHIEDRVEGMGLTTHHHGFSEELEEYAVDSVVTAAPAPLAAARTRAEILPEELSRLRGNVATAELIERAAAEGLRDAERDRAAVPCGPPSLRIAILLVAAFCILVLLSAGVAAFLGHAFAAQNIGGIGRELGLSPSTVGFGVAFLLALGVTGSPILLSALPGVVPRPFLASVVLVIGHVTFSVALAVIRGQGEIGVLLGAYAAVEVVLGAVGLVWGWKLGPIMARFYECREALAAADAKVEATSSEYATAKALRIDADGTWRQELAAVTAREEAEDELKRNSAQARRAARIAYVAALARLRARADEASRVSLTRE